MSLVTKSKVRDRVYQRAFDHEEAQRLRAEGWTWRALADHFGVSSSAVERVCKPEMRARLDASVKRNLAAKRRPCRGGCGALVWMHMAGRSGYCPACSAALTTAADVREGELRCTRCREWKPDDAFGAKGSKSRRNKRPNCKQCEAELRREHRRKKPEMNKKTSRDSKRKGKEMRTFLVLRKGSDNGSWSEIGEVEASSRLHAIEKAAKDNGTFAALSQGDVMPVEETRVFKVTNTGPGAKKD